MAFFLAASDLELPEGRKILEGRKFPDGKKLADEGRKSLVYGITSRPSVIVVDDVRDTDDVHHVIEEALSEAGKHVSEAHQASTAQLEKDISARLGVAKPRSKTSDPMYAGSSLMMDRSVLSGVDDDSQHRRGSGQTDGKLDRASPRELHSKLLRDGKVKFSFIFCFS